MDFTLTKHSSTPESLSLVASGPEPGNSLEHDAPAPTKRSSTPESLGRVASGPEPGNLLEHDAPTPTKRLSTPESLGRVASGPEPGNSLEHDASVLNHTPARRPSKKAKITPVPTVRRSIRLFYKNHPFNGSFSANADYVPQN
ncbi:uncharacterized protein PGTG_09721 [Puccinia graminis f. sp. tritici CRL 75-36-700-3]|uniref:Uncharacterized protein n=1 Tax=Puccinia graminis f. sp. tritici (strain CRL 75-36-700-3 / race SCCL) TaxID=418459 RepID=E3KI83_PUCGT|nr:uncharacterized protein PGTG_09721 [Puccinia graminis f. sp. tritici CRL 75-36-700-3]EFP84008.1 hypothetical protein PGTG_09721 [Puccinia graminis f. sp. tritici CRL 75-36-700-3]